MDLYLFSLTSLCSSCFVFHCGICVAFFDVLRILRELIFHNIRRVHYLPSLIPKRAIRTYSRTTLLDIGRPYTTLDPTICSKLKLLRIHSSETACTSHRKKRRPYRAGRNLKRGRPVPVLELPQTRTSSFLHCGIGQNRGSILKNLINIPFISPPTSNSCLQVACFNARSVGSSSRRTDICDFIIDNNVDVLFITETWLKQDGDEAKLFDLTPAGYSIKSFPRNSRGGGIAILAKDSLLSRLTFSTDFGFDHSTFEIVHANLSMQKTSINFFCLYRPPPSQRNNLSDSMFLQQFPKLLEFAHTTPGCLLILGDFNFHFDCPSDPCMAKILDFLNIFNLEQSVRTPTHKGGHIIDWIIHRPSDNILQNTNISYELSSDHYCITCQLDVSLPAPRPALSKRRNIKSINRMSFMKDISDNLATAQTVTPDILDQCLRSTLDTHAPPLSYKKSTKCDPWYNSICEQLTTAKRERRKAERQWLSSGLTVHWEIYQATKKKVTTLIHDAKSTYFSSKITASRSCKELHAITSSLLSKQKKSSPTPNLIPQDALPDMFSNFFANKIKSIRSELELNQESVPSSPFRSDINFHGSPLGTFSTMTTDSLRTLLNKCTPTTCELDPIPTPLLLECIEKILPALTDIINTSLTSGVFPSIFKQAVVRPLLKKSSLDPNDLNNYRPVSNLSFFSKILEKVVLSQILTHINSNRLISQSQSAYRPGYSTETALLKVTNDLLTAMDNNDVSILTLLDLSAAFDTIDHEILLSRLQNTFGFEGTVLSWFRSYLTGRRQYVSINGKKSLATDVPYGVPQGSVLGPILFILYTQPLSHVISQHPVSHMLYADDTQLYRSSSIADINSSLQKMEHCINDARSWMLSNKLLMNDKKTEAIIVGSKRLLKSDILPSSIMSNRTSVLFSKTIRNLGVTFDQYLSLHQHTLNICRASYIELRRISSIRRFLSEDATKTLMCSYVLSRLDYCNSLFAGAPLNLTQELQRVQNVAARITVKARKTEHTSHILEHLHWLPVQQRIRHKVCGISYSSLAPTGPTYLADLVNVYTPSRFLRSSKDSHTLVIPMRQKKSCGQRSFSYQAPTLWNDLPSDLRKISSFPSFKKSLKTHFFRQTFK